MQQIVLSILDGSDRPTLNYVQDSGNPPCNSNLKRPYMALLFFRSQMTREWILAVFTAAFFAGPFTALYIPVVLRLFSAFGILSLGHPTLQPAEATAQSMAMLLT